MIHDMSYMIVSDHLADLHREADRARLTKLATMCRPSGFSGLLGRLRGRGGCDQ